MNSEDWAKIKGLFDATIELAPAKRKHFLDNSCGADEELRREVEELLASYTDADSFMEQPAAEDAASLIIESKYLEAGKRFGHYEIIRQIGAGGMGEVYLAKDKKLDRKVAIKILNENFSRHESNLQRFIQEAKAASALNHPNILIIHEIGESENSNYIVSEFIEGKTLREVIQKSQLELPEILEIATQIAGALVAAHDERIVHRDIKPENIIVRPDGFAKILDFGLAKLLEEKSFIGLGDETAKQNQTAKGLILGTVNYMSPEQAKGEKIDARTDVFSFGVLLYEMIAGKTPFSGESMSDTFANLINKEPQPLSGIFEGVPEVLQRILAKTLRKNKDERYQTMKGLLADLKHFRENLAFDQKFQRSHSPNSENATAFLQTTGHVNNQTNEPSNTSTGRFKSRRPLTVLAFAVFLIATIGFGYYLWSVKNKTSSVAVKKSLAVLPFINAGQDANVEYLSDGITESVINNLSQITSLRVMSRNSAFRFKNNQTDTKAIAAQLGVETLVTGDIKQLGDKLIINVRLIDTSDDSQIWGNQYIKSSSDILTAQTEIAQAVAQNLRLKLTGTEQQQLAKRPTENFEAYQLYLRGRFHVFKLTPPEINRGISYFQQAIEVDPNYALAFAGLSDAFRSLSLGSEINPGENLPKSKAAAEKAIEIDETLSEGHTALGAVFFWGEWDWTTAENQFTRALELDPNSANAHLFYAHLLSNTGRHAEALNEIKLARELDPLFPFVGALEGQFLLHAGRTDEALARLKQTFELAPNFWMPHLFASNVYIEKGMYAEAIAEARKATEFGPAQTVSIASEGYAMAKSGRQGEARKLLEKLLNLSKERFIPPDHIAMIYNGLGETDKALDWLEKGYEQRDPKMAFLKVEPKWNNLRNKPRFIELIRRMKFE